MRDILEVERKGIMYITRRKIQDLIDEKMKYGQDKCSQEVFSTLEKDDSNRHLITRQRLYKYFDKYDHYENIDMDGYRYKKEDVETMIKDEKINKLLCDQMDRKTQYYYPFDTRVPNIVVDYYESEQFAEDGENRRIITLLNKKAKNLTADELEELLNIKTTKVWKLK